MAQGLRYRPSGREPRDPAVLPERPPVHRQVGDRERPHRRLQAGDLHHRGARRAQRPLEWPQAARRRAQRAAPAAVRRDVRALLRAGRVPGVGIGGRRGRGARAASGRLERRTLRRGAGASLPPASAASMPKRCSSATSPSTAAATITSASSISRWPTISARPRFQTAQALSSRPPQVFRIFRDPMRSVVELGGLSLDSYLDFNADICSRIHRLVAGPPALRSRQLLALMDAGRRADPVRSRPGSRPGRDGSAASAGRTRISSTAFEHAYVATMSTS